jgi:hypothetical protein
MVTAWRSFQPHSSSDEWGFFAQHILRSVGETRRPVGVGSGAPAKPHFFRTVHPAEKGRPWKTSFAGFLPLGFVRFFARPSARVRACKKTNQNCLLPHETPPKVDNY